VPKGCAPCRKIPAVKAGPPALTRLRTGAVGVLLVLALGGLPACSEGGSERLSTPASLRIVSPERDAQTGPEVDLLVELDRARIISGGEGATLKPGEGHVHVSLDGKLVAMSYDLRRRLTSLSPGPHTVEAEFVAADHLPFRNPVTAAVTFTVG
jgi:hypothetical protein